MNYRYQFPVVRGTQSGRDYYIAMVPLGMLTKLFPEDYEYVPPEYRAQRKLNEVRIPEIKRYILENRDTYVFSALAASIDGNYTFKPVYQDEIGILEVDMNAKFLINDGQHRKAAILAAIEESPELADETISVVFYEDKGLERSQQMFTDLNKHAVKTSNSIAELYDFRDALAVVTRNMVLGVSFLNEYVDKERDNLGKFSSSLFALNTFYNANKRILRRNACDAKFENFVNDFWRSVTKYMTPWKEVESKELSKIDLREQFIASQAVIIQALGKVGAFLYDVDSNDLDTVLSGLERINWRRSNPVWKLRVINGNGRMVNSEKAITLAAIAIKQMLGLKLTEDEEFEEENFKKYNSR